MLISSMEPFHYYPLPKETYLEIDTSSSHLDPNSLYFHYNEENSPKNGTKSSLYKTELCKRFNEFGSCRYGTKCQFAHGLGELRHVLRHPKYKTTKCKSYWGSGHCPYGSRCRFIHEETEHGTTIGGGNGASMMLVPPYSPQGTSMFFQDSMESMYSAANTMNHEYGDYAFLYDKQMSGWPLQQHQHQHQQEPDLQHAIDALMKFSIDSDPSSHCSPHEQGENKQGGEEDGAEEGEEGQGLALEATELWREFPLTRQEPIVSSSIPESTLDPHVSVVDFGNKREWPASLTLSLEGTGLFHEGEGKEGEEGGDERVGHKEEKSPRLSIFERFH